VLLLLCYNAISENLCAQDTGNFKIGPVIGDVSASIGFEYNDNITLAPPGGDVRGDFIITPSARLDLTWQMTRENTLSLDLDVGYRFYLENSDIQNNALSISPGSILEFEFSVGQYWRFRLYDAFELDHDPLNYPTINNTVNFGRFSNVAGIEAFWDVTPNLIAEFAYANAIVIGEGSEFNYLNRMTHIFSAGLVYDLRRNWVVGLTASALLTDYQEDFNNNSVILSAGPFVEGQLTEFVDMTASASWMGGRFSDDGLFFDDSNLDSFSAFVRFDHEVNWFLTQSLEGGQSVDLGETSNFLTLRYLRHATRWEITQFLTAGTELIAEWGDQSGGIDAEDFFRFGAVVYADYQLTEKATVRLEYSYFNKNSNFAFRDYQQNRVGVFFVYDF